MYGKTVTVIYEGREMKMWIPCIPSTSTSELKERAIKKLQRIVFENPLLTLDEIQEQFEICAL